MHSRVEQIFFDEMQGDTSFQEKGNFFSLLFGGISYSKYDMRKTWDMGIKHGIELGLNRSDVKGQRIELYNNLQNERQREFIDKFYKLAEEYNCSISYHPREGMCITDLKH